MRLEEGMLATNCVLLLEMTDVRAGHSLPFIPWEWHESRFIFGEKRGLGMACFYYLLFYFACARDFCLLFTSLSAAPFRALAEPKMRQTFENPPQRFLTSH